ncbi:MAG: acyltransferase family protein [Lachnospiraceae bacterium]|nr:acyltransferase family protein [Lachnospiraceae bacterium]
MSSNGERNKTFTILSCIGIVLIILGHLNFGILEFGGLFPYYSYHVMIFVFVSGYFYKKEDEKNILGLVKRKAKRLLLPYMITNLLIGIIVSLLHRAGIIFGGRLTPVTLFVEPFTDGHQFMLNAPAWFIPALFLLELFNVIARKVLGYVKADNEYVIFVIYFLLGIACVILSQRGSIYDYYRIPGRIMLMAPVFQAGRLYAAKLERFNNLGIIGNGIYFTIILILNLILCKTMAGLGFSVAWVNGFNNNPFIPFVTSFTGIALWLKISQILARIDLKNGFADYMGRHTGYICIFHLAASFALNSLLAFLHTKGSLDGFDMTLYKGDVYYAYVPAGADAFKLIYLAVCIILPIVFCLLYDKVASIFKNAGKRRVLKQEN